MFKVQKEHRKCKFKSDENKKWQTNVVDKNVLYATVKNQDF